MPNILPHTPNRFGGLAIDIAQLPTNTEIFQQVLIYSLGEWQKAGYTSVWLPIPSTLSSHISLAVEAGFQFHHVETSYLMLNYRFVADTPLPHSPTHHVGVGGVVINEQNEVLLITEAYRKNTQPGFYKLPGGLLDPAENITDGVCREVREETGIEATFDSLVCFCHWHRSYFTKSSLYLICRLTPQTFDIQKDEIEIDECLWMPIDQFLALENIGSVAQNAVRLALQGAGYMVPGVFPNYKLDGERGELFLPALS